MKAYLTWRRWRVLMFARKAHGVRQIGRNPLRAWFDFWDGMRQAFAASFQAAMEESLSLAHARMFGDMAREMSLWWMPSIIGVFAAIRVVSFLTAPFIALYRAISSGPK